MSDNDPQRRPPLLLLGFAGCGITFLFAAPGVVAGGWIGWIISPPQPAHVNEYSGLNEFFETVFHLGAALTSGGVLGLVAGVIVSLWLFRRVKPVANTGPRNE